MKRLGIGVRVRVVGYGGSAHEFLGKEGVIVRHGNKWVWVVRFGIPLNDWSAAGRPAGLSPYEGGFDSDMLEPLLSPGTDEWAREKVKKLDRFYVEPVVTIAEKELTK